MNILVVAPMAVEAQNFKHALDSIAHKHQYRVVQSGVGKVNAATEVALELYGNPTRPAYDLIAVIGYAGGSSRLSQGDFVIPSCAKYHDVNCPEDLVPELTKTYDLQGSDNCVILTGDSFVTTQNIESVQNCNPGCDSIIFDMESAAVCQVAEETPVIVMKLISDIPAVENNLQSFSDFVDTHSNFSQFVHYLESLV